MPFEGLEESIMVSAWPKVSGFNFEKEYKEFELIKELIQGVRQIRAEAGLDENIGIYAEFEDEDLLKSLKEHIHLLSFLGGISGVERAYGVKGIPLIVKNYHFLIPVEDREKVEKMIASFRKEIEELENLLKRVDEKLKNEDFLTKAPSEVVEKEKEKKRIFELKIRRLRSYIEGLERS